jgi:hypothetical protein
MKQIKDTNKGSVNKMSVKFKFYVKRENKSNAFSGIVVRIS